MLTDKLLQNILDAPVGQVVNVLRDDLKCDVNLKVIEQTSQKPGTEFVRKVTITANELPIIKAHVKFDSKNIPDEIFVELLKKEKGIGEILNEKKIKPKRNVNYVNREEGGKKITREYEIVNEDSVWFTILEEIRLDLINS